MRGQDAPPESRVSLQGERAVTKRRQVVRIGAFASDPVACDAFHATAPEPGLLYPAINDSLIYLGIEGQVQPGLAVAWRRIDSLTMEFDLREGVRFHDGSPFCADDVVATLRAQRNPANRAFLGHGILSVIADCSKVNDFRVRIKTYMPDGMLLHRLHGASAIYPKSIIESRGIHFLRDHPIGTGGYVFERWERGREIVLSRNQDHWANLVSVDELCFPIIAQSEWVDALSDGQLDIALNIEAHEAFRILQHESLVMKHRDAALPQWLLLGQDGPLKDRRVRLALNHAVQRHALCKAGAYGWASPQASVIAPGQVGHNAAIVPYAYDPDYARQLLKEAGYANGFTLRGVVCEPNNSVYELVRVFLENIGVRLEAELVPRAQWRHAEPTGNPRGESRITGDFALISVDNSILHGLYQHAILLFSQGQYSLLCSPEYDRRFLEASAEVEPEQMSAMLQALDRYAYEEALLLFTMRPHVFCGMRQGFDIPIAASGHFDVEALWRIRVDEPLMASEPEPYALRAQPQNFQSSRELQTDAVMRALVDQIKAAANLENILRTTKPVAMLGITYTGRVLFENSGYRDVIGHASDVPLQQILVDDDGNAVWDRIVAQIDQQGMCTGVFNVIGAHAQGRRVFLTVTPALDENSTRIGYVCIFIESSTEEERLRIRREMEIAQQIQVGLLPSIGEEQRAAVAAAMIPAEEVGGDYYDIITDDNGVIWYGIGDVSGHGMTPGLLMLMTHCIVRTIIRAEPHATLDRILTVLNRVLYEDIEQLGRSHHLTFALIKSIGDGDYVAAGAHEDAIIHRGQTGECELVPLAGIWPGLMPDISGAAEEVFIHLDPGDTLILYTDGIIEAINAKGEMWGIEAFIASIRRHASLPPDRMKSAIIDDVMAFMDNQYDDITMMIIRRPLSP